MRTSRLAQILVEGPPVRDILLGPSSADRRPEREGESEGEPPKVDKKIAVYFNRLLLRIFSVQSLMTWLKDATLFATGNGNGECKIQLVFHRLPDEVIPQMLRLLAPPQKAKLFKFVDKNQARTGVEIVLTPEDLGGDEMDYAL